MRGFLLLTLLATGAALCGSRCAPSEPNPLDELRTVNLNIKGHSFRLWVAETYGEQQAGLMYITAEQMAPLSDGSERGMIFAFDHSVRTPFWMKNTIIPLDIAFIDRDGKVLNMHTMVPMDDRHSYYRPSAPYRYAIEVNAHRLGELGVKPGDVLDIPDTVLKGAP